MFKEFKKFITRGSVIDLAVGMIIGAAFNKIVSSFVADIVTPLISYITGFASVDGFDLANWTIVLRKAAEGAETADIAIQLGMFITYVIDFILTGFVIFMFIKMFNKIKDNTVKKDAAPAVVEPPKTADCPFCKKEISIDAVRCPYCTSEIDKPEICETEIGG